MKKIKLIYALLFVIAVLFSCNNEETFTENKEDIVTMTDEEINSITREDSIEHSLCFTKGEFAGMKLFMQHCNKCHPGGEKGKGPSLNDKKLPNFAIHFQIRNGLGDMPAFKKEDISKENVKKIILFVRLMRETTK